jgi:hypothetical protein
MSICLGARAAASRINGAKSRGPKTTEGKARSAQNALKHGLRAQKFVVIGDEDPRAFAALESALEGELAPDGALQGLLAGRIARAAWRLERAERIEAELFARTMDGDRSLGRALIRDCNGARAFDTLLRYRGTALAELWRALRLLKALQAEAPPHAMRAVAPSAAPLPQPQPDAGLACEVASAPVLPALREQPIEPEARRIPAGIARAPAPDESETRISERCDAAAVHGAEPGIGPEPCLRAPTACKQPIEPEARRNPREIAPAPIADQPRVESSLGRREVAAASCPSRRAGTSTVC